MTTVVDSSGLSNIGLAMYRHVVIHDGAVAGRTREVLNGGCAKGGRIFAAGEGNSLGRRPKPIETVQ